MANFLLRAVRWVSRFTFETALGAMACLAIGLTVAGLVLWVKYAPNVFVVTFALAIVILVGQFIASRNEQ